MCGCDGGVSLVERRLSARGSYGLWSVGVVVLGVCLTLVGGWLNTLLGPEGSAVSVGSSGSSLRPSARVLVRGCGLVVCEGVGGVVV
jgi:hypothetical protein